MSGIVPPIIAAGARLVTASSAFWVISALLPAELAPGAEPIIARKCRHPHSVMRDVRYDNAAPAARDAELCRFRPPAVDVELRPRKPVWPLRHRRFVPRKVFRRTVDVLIAGKDHEPIAKTRSRILKLDRLRLRGPNGARDE